MNLKYEEHDRIRRKSGRKSIECSCSLCKKQCSTPCLGTPSDILAIAEAGYSEFIYHTEWLAGIVMGVTNQPVYMLQLLQTPNGCCMLDENGLCKLHEQGLKPIEGRLSSHLIREDNWNPKKSLSWLTAQTWKDERNFETMKQIIKIIIDNGYEEHIKSLNG